MNGGLEPEELRRLLHAAVEPIRPSPEAYQRIRAGVERRRRWRMTLVTAGGLVAAALVGLAIVAIRPQPSTNQLVEPATPVIVSSSPAEPWRTTAPAAGGPGGAGTGGATPDDVNPSTPSTEPDTPPTSGLPTATPSTPAVTPTAPDGSGLPMPTPVARPAAPGGVDGDGTADRVQISGTRVEVAFSRGGVGHVTLDEVATLPDHTVVDVDADGFGEIFVQTGSSGGIDSYALLRFAGPGAVSVVDFPPGVQLGAGKGDRQGVGFRCSDGTFEIITGTSGDGSTFDLITTGWKITPDGATQVGSRTGRINLSQDPSPFVAACGSLS